MRSHQKPIILALDQEVSQQIVQVQGKVPEWLSGTYVRNGPVTVQIGDEIIPHWFDGLAMLHAFSFDQGKALYSNKFLRSSAYDSVFKDDNLYYGGFATPTKSSLWERVSSFFKSKKYPIQNANVNVASIGKKTVALTETPLPVVFDLKTLNTKGPLIFQDDLPKENSFESAHIQYDKQANEKINYLVEFGYKSFYVVYRLNDKKPIREVISKIPVEIPSYMHSFAITEHYIILVEYPMIVNPIDLMIMRKPFIKNYYWKEDLGTKFLVIDRKTGETQTIKDNNAFFAFHHVNAFEEGKNLILDIVTYPNANIISDIAQHDDINSPYALDPKTKLVRYTLSLDKNKLQSKILWDAPVEFPRINEQFNAHKYRYVYLADPRLLKNPQDLRPLYKFDTETQTHLMWQEPGMLPGEPMFIQNPKKKGEDEGVVVSIVLDEMIKNAFLLILDAKTFKELGRVYAPFSIPAGLHGQFFE